MAHGDTGKMNRFPNNELVDDDDCDIWRDVSDDILARLMSKIK